MQKKEIKIPQEYKYISAFLTMRCNLDCNFCMNAFSKTFRRERFEELSGTQWVSALNKIESRPNVPITFCGGEPSIHDDFIYLINNLKPELNVDILTNLCWGKDKIKRFISDVNPERIKRDAPYPSIRVSYHPEQMKDRDRLLESVKMFQGKGFSIGIESVMFPSSDQLSAIEKMAIQCKNEGISFRPKSFTGVYQGKDDFDRPFSITHGDYSKYENSAFQDEEKSCLCKTSDLLIGPNGNVYKCHRDLFSEEFPLGNITNLDFEIEDKFRSCNKYGQCHPCDVKLSTNHKQKIGHTIVEIKNVR